VAARLACGHCFTYEIGGKWPEMIGTQYGGTLRH
jgi:hypothetical protein